MEEKKKELEIVKGDGTNLNISPVYEHINTSRPKSNEKKPTNIIIPTSIKNEEVSDSQEKTENSSNNETTIDDVNFDLSDTNNDAYETDNSEDDDKDSLFDDLFLDDDIDEEDDQVDDNEDDDDNNK